MDKWHLLSLSQWLSRISGAGMLILAALIAVQAIQEGSPHLDGIVIAGILFFLGVGLIKNWNKAKHLFAAVLLFAAIITPIGIFNPLHNAGPTSLFTGTSAIPELLIWLIPLEICLISFAWLLEIPINKETNHKYPSRPAP